jgi:hypothetical protein
MPFFKRAEVVLLFISASACGGSNRNTITNPSPIVAISGAVPAIGQTSQLTATLPTARAPPTRPVVRIRSTPTPGAPITRPPVPGRSNSIPRGSSTGTAASRRSRPILRASWGRPRRRGSRWPMAARSASGRQRRRGPWRWAAGRMCRRAGSGPTRRAGRRRTRSRTCRPAARWRRSSGSVR